MSRRLDDLAPKFRPVVFEFLARLTEAGIHVLIVDTLRTEDEHKANLARGVSWTQRSKHLQGLAVDVCPYALYDLHGPDKLQWDANDPVWERMASIGESLGMRSGYRWRQKDCGHFEWMRPKPKAPTGVV